MGNGEWIEVEPVHCHKRLPGNTLVERLRVVSEDKSRCELLMKFDPDELRFFFDHEIDHLPGMLQVCSLRQAVLALAHLVYDLPMDYMTVMDWTENRCLNFAELGVETRTLSTLCNLDRSRGRMELVLEFTMLQGELPTMRARGKMTAFAPRLAAKVRATKREAGALDRIQREQHNDALLVEVHIETDLARLAEVSAELERVLKGEGTAEHSLVPLYFTRDEEDSEIRICLRFEDPRLLEDFVVERIRSIGGVQNTRIRMTLDGKIYPEGLEMLAGRREDTLSSHVFIATTPVHDHESWRALCGLRSRDDVFPVWCMRDFYDYDRNISLRVMGRDRQTITGYIEENVKSIEGVTVTAIKFMKDLVKIQDDATLIELAGQWMRK
jgi:DNA-binding Lrp family transcriptional regulator